MNESLYYYILIDGKNELTENKWVKVQELNIAVNEATSSKST